MRTGTGNGNGWLEAAEAYPRLSPSAAFVSLVTGLLEQDVNSHRSELVDLLEGGIQGVAGIAFDLFFQLLIPATVASLNVLLGSAFGFRSAAEMLANDLPIDSFGAGVIPSLVPAHTSAPGVS